MSTNDDYVHRVNRVIDAIVADPGQAKRLSELAALAGMSKFHFHRVFQVIMGETLLAFSKRVRLERALYLMSHARAKTLTQIALECGFASSSDFSRSFKQKYGVPPSAFDIDAFRQTHRFEMGQLLSQQPSRHQLRQLPPEANPDRLAVRVVSLPERRVAYLRIKQPYQGDGVIRGAEQLVAWANDHGLAGGQWYGYQWDDPEVVPLAQCRYDVAVEVPREFRVTEHVGSLVFPAMQVAEVAIDGDVQLELRALDWLFQTWLPRSGYVPDEQPLFEAWHGLPFADGTERFRLRLQLPIVRG